VGESSVLGAPKRQRRRFPVIVVSLLGAVLVSWLVARAPLPFVSSWWEAGANNWGDPLKKRHRMADWLLLSHSLVGKNRTELVRLLGAPPETDYFRDWDLVYPLGAERGFISIDSEWLVVRLNERGEAVDARIVRD
jgi:hypothetical protein